MADVLRSLAPLVEHEPRSTLALAAALRSPTSRDVKVLTAGPGGRSICPLVRHSLGVWVAYPVLGSSSDAAELGRLIDGSNVVRIDGDSADVGSLRGHVRRAGEWHTHQMFSAPPQKVAWPDPDESTRMATAFDVPELTRVLADGSPPTPTLRRRVETAVDRMWVIVSIGEDGAVDGAMVMEGFTPGYMAWGQLTVDPAARNRRRSWAMAGRAISLYQASGLGVLAVLADDNPMTMPEWGTMGETTRVNMSLPDRVPGERRLRLQLHRARKMRASRPWAGMLEAR